MLVALVLQAGVAHARFGKANSGGTVPRSSSSSSSSSSSRNDTHRAVPVDSPGSSRGSNARAPSVSGRTSFFSFEPRSWSHGFYSGAYVPMLGYGYGYYYLPGVLVTEPQPALLEPAELRVTANLELGVFVNPEARGFVMGLNAMFEGERLGVVVNGQAIMVGADDGSNDTDALQQLTGKLTFAFLTGRYGRLRAELGGDVIWAPDMIVIGASLGLSGTVWLVDALAFEGSLWGTVYPFWQIDGRAGLVYGLGPVGFRLGFRAQMLDDRGLVDGQIHRDFFIGPYAGVGVAF